ncbi:MAG: hypothetical protein AABZ47_06155 [Planctomycetota bacterium]
MRIILMIGFAIVPVLGSEPPRVDDLVPSQTSKASVADDRRSFTAEEVLEGLRRADANLLTAAKLQFTIFVQVFPPHPEVGSYTTECTVTCVKGDFALSTRVSHHDPLIYFPPGTSGTLHDDENHYMYSGRPIGSMAFHTTKEASSISEHQPYLVAPDGSVTTERGTYLHGTRFRPSEDIGTLLFRDSVRATGRGFGELIDRITSMDIRSDGLVVILAEGNRGPSLPGRWRMVIELTKSGFLVREAVFGTKSLDEPTFTVENSGMCEAGGFSIAAHGTLRYPGIGPGRGYEQDVTTISCFGEADEKFFVETESAVRGAFQQDIGITDRTGAVPRMYRNSERDLP